MPAPLQVIGRVSAERDPQDQDEKNDARDLGFHESQRRAHGRPPLAWDRWRRGGFDISRWARARTGALGLGQLARQLGVPVAFGGALIEFRAGRGCRRITRSCRGVRELCLQQLVLLLDLSLLIFEDRHHEARGHFRHQVIAFDPARFACRPAHPCHRAFTFQDLELGSGRERMRERALGFGGSMHAGDEPVDHVDRLGHRFRGRLRGCGVGCACQ